MNKNNDVITLIQNTFKLKSTRVANFADLIKTITMFVNTTSEDANNLYKLCIKIQFMSVFLDITKFVEFGWKIADVSRNQGMCHVIYMFFRSCLGKV